MITLFTVATLKWLTPLKAEPADTEPPPRETDRESQR